MPASLERKLRAEAKKKFKTKKKQDEYVYGAMNNMGAMKGNKITAKGKAMEKAEKNKKRTTRKTARKPKKK